VKRKVDVLFLEEEYVNGMKELVYFIYMLKVSESVNRDYSLAVILR